MALKWLKWLPALLWMALIFSFSHQAGGESGTLARQVLEFLASFGLDLPAWLGWDTAVVFIRKGAHFTEYFILFMWIWWALGAWAENRKRSWISLAVTVLYACSDEFHQTFIPGRSGNITDVLVDGSGAAFGALLVLWIGWLRKRRAQRFD